QFRKLDRAYRQAEIINNFVAAAPRFVIEGAGIIVIAIIALYASGRPGGIMAMLPIIGALALGAQRLLPLLQLIYSGWSQFRGASVLLVDVERLLTAPVSPDQRRETSKALLPFEHELRLAEVSFRYERQERPALDGIDLAIAKGQRIGLIGTTGSGKSTLIDVIMGLLEPCAGHLAVDGVRLDESNRAYWQARIAHVPQSIYLSDSSITANIAFGEQPGSVNMERVRAAAEVAQIDDFIAGLPNGYETISGERGIQLSGGQRQRIGIARAIYKQADVLILDEATSALDQATEARVMAALSGFGRELTIIMIAHRVSTLSYCDRLVQLEGGRIVASGTYSEVIGALREDQSETPAKRSR
ncbi:MAG TPA: ATP-binding cassette domain-containing protein, partial [Sphingomicrobium sp.]|nr:ATP-binding cassette domain-containing protein [Sphingomicrobium sp.]